MGWGTTYNYDGYLSRIREDELYDKLEECKKVNDLIWREILAYMSSTPPAMAKDDEGHEYPWPEFIAARAQSMRDELEESMNLIAHIEDCIESQQDRKDDGHR